MPITIKTVPAKTAAVKPQNWYSITIGRITLRGRVLRLTDQTTGCVVTICRGYHGVYLTFFLRPGDSIDVKGYTTLKNTVCCNGEIKFRGKTPSDIKAREVEAEQKAEEYWENLYLEG